MKMIGIVLIAAALPLCSFAATIDLHNTGVNADGSLAAIGSIDLFYTNTDSTVFVINQHPAWVPTDGLANYVAPDTNQGQDFLGGVYTLDYSISFDLTGLDPNSVLIQGGWSTDNSGNDILVNGVSTGNTSPSFGAFTNFNLAGGSGLFNSGINTLDFRWSNSGGPGGLAVEFASATADTATPEPASIALFGLGAGLLAIGKLRHKLNR